jgi:hypothetical protein
LSRAALTCVKTGVKPSPASSRATAKESAAAMRSGSVTRGTSMETKACPCSDLRGSTAFSPSARSCVRGGRQLDPTHEVASLPS